MGALLLCVPWLARAADDDVTSLVQVHAGSSRKRGVYFWSGKNGDPLRTGASPYPVITSLEGGPSWSFFEELGSNTLVRSAPLIDDERNVYLATIKGNVHKFTPGGKRLWTYSDAAEIPEVPAMYDGAVYVTNTKGFVTAIDMQTGQPRWSVQVAASSAGDTWSMSAGEGTVISACSTPTDPGKNSKLVGLDSASGQVKWTFEPDTSVYNSLQAIVNGTLVFSDYTGKIYRLNLASGELIWKSGPATPSEQSSPDFSTGGTVIGPNGVAYVTSNAKFEGFGSFGFVTAFRLDNGEVLWRKSVEYQANNGAAVGYLDGGGGRLAVVIGVGENPDMPNTEVQMAAHIKDGDKRLKEKRARVLALDAATGEYIWRFELEPWHGWAAGDRADHICLPDSFGNPTIGGDGTVYIGFESGFFYAIKDKDGDGSINTLEEVSAFDAKNAFQGSPAIGPGMLVATPCNGMHVFLSWPRETEYDGPQEAKFQVVSPEQSE